MFKYTPVSQVPCLRFFYARCPTLQTSYERNDVGGGDHDAASVDTGRVMGEERRPYIAYLLRLWQAPGGGASVWRASLEDPHTGERRGFGSLNELVAFLRAATEEIKASPDDPQAGVDQM